MWAPQQLETYAFNTPVYSDSNSSMSYEDRVPSYTNIGTSNQDTGSSPDSGYEENSPVSGPVLEIEEHPESSYRFRYLRESVKPHGPLKGEFSEGKTPKNSSGPKVKLVNFEGEAIIRIWLWEQNIEDGPSPHRLLSSKNKEGIKDEPHDIIVNEQNHYRACFDKLNIVHVVQGEKEYQKCYLRKKGGFAKRFGDTFVRDIPDLPQVFSEKNVKAEFKNKNKDICALYFEAFEKVGDSYLYIANGISRPIKNKKSPKTNDLKIVRSSICEGTVAGGDTIFIFTEKLVKEIRIVFFDDDDWQADAIFEEKDIHKQVAVAFKTPPYKDPNIKEPVTVYYHIERTSAVPAISEPELFRYLPAPAHYEVLDSQPPKRKRPQQAQADAVPPVDVLYKNADPTLDDPMLSSTFRLGDPEILTELLQYNEDVTEFMCEDLNEVSTSDLVTDNLPQRELDAYKNWYKDSTPVARGVDPTRLRLSTKIFQNASKLHISIINNDMENFINLLSNEVVNYKIRGQTPLHLAVKLERLPMINRLLGAKADIYALDGEQSNTPVHVAIMSSFSALQILLSSKIPPSSVFNKDGDDPVIFAIRNMKLMEVKVLLKQNFSLETSNIKNGDGPLHVALMIPDYKIRYDMTCLLLKHNVSVSRQNRAGLSALDLANSYPQPEGLIEKLELRLSEEILENSETEDEEELDQRLNSLRLEDHESLERSSHTDDSGCAASASFQPINCRHQASKEKKLYSVTKKEPYLALDGDVDTSKKVADLTQCAFLKPILAGAQKQSQVLLKQLERKMSPAEAVKTLNDAYTHAKGLSTSHKDGTAATSKATQA